MIETDELLNLAASHFKTGEAQLKDAEHTFYTLNERLEDIREPITKFLQAALPSFVSLDQFIQDYHPIESNNEEVALQNLESKLEVNLKNLVGIWSDKSVDSEEL